MRRFLLAAVFVLGMLVVTGCSSEGSQPKVESNNNPNSSQVQDSSGGKPLKKGPRIPKAPTH